MLLTHLIAELLVLSISTLKEPIADELHVMIPKAWCPLGVLFMSTPKDFVVSGVHNICFESFRWCEVMGVASGSLKPSEIRRFGPASASECFARSHMISQMTLVKQPGDAVES